MKIDPPIWITDFECMNVPIESANENESMEKLFVNKPVAIGYYKLKNSGYDNLKLENEGHVKCFREDCVEWFINEMLEIQTHMKGFFKTEIEVNLEYQKIMKKALVCYVKRF